MDFKVLAEYVLITVAALFVIVNPLTTAFVFISLLPRASEARRRAVARRSVVVATGVFFAFAILGGVIFKLFGITLEAFRVAGGLILFGIAMRMLNPRPNGPLADGGPAAAEATDDVAIVPLAIPFISGPGSIATVMILTSEAPSTYHLGVVFAAILLATGACWLAMTYSRVVVRWLGDAGHDIASRLFGLILAVVAVQFVINGVLEVYARLAMPPGP